MTYSDMAKSFLALCIQHRNSGNIALLKNCQRELSYIREER